MEKKGGTVSITTFIIGLVAVAAIVGAGVYFLASRAAPAEPTAAEPAAPEEAAPVDMAVVPKYDLNEETAYELTMERHAFEDWGHNAPNIHEYRVEAPFTIGYITSWRGNPWQEVNIAEFTREVERSALIEEYVHMDSAGSVDTEINNLRDMFTMWKAGDLDGIIVDPLDPMALVDTIEEIYDAGCPIILFNDSADTTKYTSFVSDDPWTYGTAGAEWLVEELGGEGKILFFRGLKAYPIDDARIRPEICRELEGIDESHQIELHEINGSIYLSCHLLVHADIPIADVHRLAEETESRLRHEFPELGRVVAFSLAPARLVCVCSSANSA